MDFRERVLGLIKEVLAREERVVFAYAYGSFIRDEPFRDIDIAIYLRDPGANPFVVSSEVKTELYFLARKENLNLTADEFDVPILNGAPFTFLKTVFMEGILLMDRDPELRTDLIEYVSLKYRECAGLLAEESLL